MSANTAQQSFRRPRITAARINTEAFKKEWRYWRRKLKELGFDCDENESSQPCDHRCWYAASSIPTREGTTEIYLGISGHVSIENRLLYLTSDSYLVPSGGHILLPVKDSDKTTLHEVLDIDGDCVLVRKGDDIEPEWVNVLSAIIPEEVAKEKNEKFWKEYDAFVNTLATADWRTVPDEALESEGLIKKYNIRLNEIAVTIRDTVCLESGIPLRAGTPVHTSDFHSNGVYVYTHDHRRGANYIHVCIKHADIRMLSDIPPIAFKLDEAAMRCYDSPTPIEGYRTPRYDAPRINAYCILTGMVESSSYYIGEFQHLSLKGLYPTGGRTQVELGLMVAVSMDEVMAAAARQVSKIETPEAVIASLPEGVREMAENFPKSPHLRTMMMNIFKRKIPDKAETMHDMAKFVVDEGGFLAPYASCDTVLVDNWCHPDYKNGVGYPFPSGKQLRLDKNPLEPVKSDNYPLVFDPSWGISLPLEEAIKTDKQLPVNYRVTIHKPGVSVARVRRVSMEEAVIQVPRVVQSRGQQVVEDWIHKQINSKAIKLEKQRGYTTWDSDIEVVEQHGEFEPTGDTRITISR